MKEFMTYFFGAGTEIEFEIFTLAHILPIVIMFVLIYLMYRYKDTLRDSKMDMSIRYIIAFTLIISEMSYYWRLVGMPSLGPNPVEHLPIAVCGWVAIFCSFMVIGKSQTLFDISYFWLFAGSVFALLTPAVISYTGPTRFRYYQFWIEHIGGFIAIFYMMFVHKMRPTIQSMVKSYVALVIMAIIAYNANQIIGSGANYLYMARPEAAPSILDILPPNFVLRLCIMAFAITVLFGVAYLPWYLKDKKELDN
ncbi:MAG: TIGR02206 family membrane protein [Erysipelotrichaceae bacterium]|nr:TIGR02206 family membrane protein [Erysipelotrichaceae bacterium]